MVIILYMNTENDELEINCIIDSLRVHINIKHV